MKILTNIRNSYRKSHLIPQIETAKRKLESSPNGESIRYELELIALRTQMRLMDNRYS